MCQTQGNECAASANRTMNDQTPVVEGTGRSRCIRFSAVSPCMNFFRISQPCAPGRPTGWTWKTTDTKTTFEGSRRKKRLCTARDGDTGSIPTAQDTTSSNVYDYEGRSGSKRRGRRERERKTGEQERTPRIVCVLSHKKTKRGGITRSYFLSERIAAVFFSFSIFVLATSGTETTAGCEVNVFVAAQACTVCSKL